MQLNSLCPKECMHKGKLNPKDLNKKVSELNFTGSLLIEDNPAEAVRLYERALELDGDNYECLIGIGTAYGKLGKHDVSVEFFKKAAAIRKDGDLYYNIAKSYRRANKLKECIDFLSGVKDSMEEWIAQYLLGECYFLSGNFEGAEECMMKVTANNRADDIHLNKARIVLAKIHLSNRDIDKVMENAEAITGEFEEDKNNLIESAFFASGRMYELLSLINSMDKIGNSERFMLLQCALVLKKNNQGSIINIIEDILASEFCRDNPYEEIRLIGLKVRLLFKELKIKDAYDTFVEYEDRLVNAARSIYDCFESCNLIAFFLYNLDKAKAINIYRTITGVDIDQFIIDELYNAFTTMDITPYVRAKAIEKSVELLKSGKSEDFNRTGIVADILYEYGEFSQAFELYKRILGKDKPDTIVMYKVAICLMKQNKYEEALDTFINILDLTKFIPGIYPGIIRCCLETDREWIEFFKCLELEKLSFSEIYELAGMLMAREHYDKAGYLYSYIIEKFKNMDIYSRKMVYHNMAAVYRSLKDYYKAMDIINEIPGKYFGECLSIDMGCLYYDTGEYDKSYEIFMKAAEISDNPVVYFNLGILYIKLRNYEKAVDYFNASIEKTIDEIKNKKAFNAREYGSMLVKLYRNSSLCLLKLGKFEEALLTIEKAVNIEKSQKVMDAVSIIQRQLLNRDKGMENWEDDIEQLTDNCMGVKEGFTEDIRRLLDSILKRIDRKTGKKFLLKDDLSDSIASFIRNERRIYGKYGDSIERSEGTFQRYVDNLISSFERKVLPEDWKETAAAAEENVNRTDIIEYSKMLMDLGDRLFKNFEYTRSEEYIYASLIPYYKIIKMLSVSMVYPYYKKNIHQLPAPEKLADFKDIGIYSYKAGGEDCYRIDFSFNISCSEYLFEINCHPGLRSEYINHKKHFMPWGKLLWMISGIKKKWNVVDDAKSVGLLLLFYSAYKNYLAIEGDFNNSDEIIKLSGDLIHINNERDYYIRNMLRGNYEFDYLNCVSSARNIAQRCMEGLLKIKRIE